MSQGRKVITPAKPKYTAAKRIFLLITIVVPVVALLVNQLPSFTVKDASCRITSCLDHAITELSHQYDQYRSASVPYESQLYNDTMFWGTYRPNVLMGVKSRSAHPLLFGIAWYDEKGYIPTRHDATENEHLMFRWELHDGVFFGSQIIVDKENRLEVTVDFLKLPDGSGWNVRVTCRRESSHPLYFVTYFAHEGGAKLAPLSVLVVGADNEHLPSAFTPDDAEHIAAFGSDAIGVAGAVLGDNHRRRFVAAVSDECPLFANRTQWEIHQFTKPQGSSWNLDFRSAAGISKTQKAFADRNGKHNVVVLKKRYTSDFRATVALRDDSYAGPDRFLTQCQLSQTLQSQKVSFENRFLATFGSSFNDDRVIENPKLAERHRNVIGKQKALLLAMTSSALSNLIGGIGYWEGKYLTVAKEIDELSDAQGKEVKSLPGRPSVEEETTAAVTLFSAVPSRAKFPRGFLWDEGFHQLLLSKWDPEISKDVISHWLLSVIDESTGWIPREQILGSEARSRVPREFTAQHPLHANPPSMVLTVQDFALKRNKTVSDRVFLQRILPNLKKWRDWFHNSQCGGHNCTKLPRSGLDEVMKLGSLDEIAVQLRYRWRSRNNFHLLACGLDDYPRPVCPRRHRRELHVDLVSWMSLMTTTINVIERETSLDGDEQSNEERKGIPWEGVIESLHYDSSNHRFADVTGCDGHVPANVKTTAFNDHFSPYVGYVSLFPLVTMAINDRAKALEVIRLAKRNLNSGFGLQSLSNSSRNLLDTLHQSHENYWTGPIWINLNFMFLRALKLKYIDLVGAEARDFYEELRLDLIENIAKEFKRTGKLWENYHWGSGKGQGTAPFTGWTALIVLILGEKY